MPNHSESKQLGQFATYSGQALVTYVKNGMHAQSAPCSLMRPWKGVALQLRLRTGDQRVMQRPSSNDSTGHFNEALRAALHRLGGQR